MDDKNIIETQDHTSAVDATKRRRGFSLLDLMIAASAFAISFSILQNASRAPGSINLKDPIWNGVFQAVTSVFTALTLFGAIQISRGWWTKQGRFHPGHLMIWIGILTVFLSVIRGLIFAWDGTAESFSIGVEGSEMFFRFVFFGVQIAFGVVAIGLALYGVFTKASNWSWWWRTTFIVFAFSYISSTAQATIVLSGDYRWLGLLGLVNSVIFIILVVSVIASIIADARIGLRRDTSHWMGIVCGIGPPIFFRCFMMVVLNYFDPSEIFQAF